MGKKYQSPYDPVDPYNGLPVTIIGTTTAKRIDGGPGDELHVVQFSDGHTSTAWADEIVDEDGD
jgi:hypothetical protein